MTHCDHLADLIRRVPCHLVDLERAAAAGDREGLRYAAAMDVWLTEALSALQRHSTMRVRDPRTGGGKSRVDRRDGPDVDPSSELVSARDFPPGLAI